jgi:hypothetical protein
MNEHKMCDYEDDIGGDEEYIVYRASKRGEPAHYDAQRQECRQIPSGLRVLDCFSPALPTLTADEISDLIDLPEHEVTQHAARLADLGYLRAVLSNGEGAWTLIDADNTR